VNAAFNFTDNDNAAAESAAISATRVGWTVGAGAEYALMNGWSIKGEYLHVDLGSSSVTSTNLTSDNGAFAFPASVFTHSIDWRWDIARVGLNYKFGGPVVARY
jgi:outer membrane immunogenic protein